MTPADADEDDIGRATEPESARITWTGDEPVEPEDLDDSRTGENAWAWP